MKRELMQQVLAALLIFLFVYASVSKLSDVDLLQEQLSMYPYIKGSAGILAFLIPFTELAISALLLFPATRYAAFHASLALLILFTVYLVIMLATQTNLPCSCGGVIEKLSWQGHILFNLFFMITTFIGIRMETYHKEAADKSIASLTGIQQST